MAETVCTALVRGAADDLQAVLRSIGGVRVEGDVMLNFVSGDSLAELRLHPSSSTDSEIHGSGSDAARKSDGLVVVVGKESGIEGRKWVDKFCIEKSLPLLCDADGSKPLPVYLICTFEKGTEVSPILEEVLEDAADAKIATTYVTLPEQAYRERLEKPLEALKMPMISFGRVLAKAKGATGPAHQRGKRASIVELFRRRGNEEQDRAGPLPLFSPAVAPEGSAKAGGGGGGKQAGRRATVTSIMKGISSAFSSSKSKPPDRNGFVPAGFDDVVGIEGVFTEDDTMPTASQVRKWLNEKGFEEIAKSDRFALAGKAAKRLIKLLKMWSDKCELDYDSMKSYLRRSMEEARKM